MSDRPSKRNGKLKFHVGTSGYAYKDWKGKFYPPKDPAKQMLPFYAEHFSVVEINNTFYRLPQASVFDGWAAQVPADFQFTLKCPQRITHFRRLKNSRALVKQFVKAGLRLKERLGPLLFQLPPNMKKDAKRLAGFVKSLPTDQRVAFEFRHASWFDEEVFEILRQYNIALCIAETDEELQVPFVATADWGYIRLRMYDYSDADLKARIRQIRKQKWKEAYVFFKHEDEANGPRMAKRFVELC